MFELLSKISAHLELNASLTFVEVGSLETEQIMENNIFFLNSLFTSFLIAEASQTSMLRKEAEMCQDFRP